MLWILRKNNASIIFNFKLPLIFLRRKVSDFHPRHPTQEESFQNEKRYNEHKKNLTH